MAMAFIMDKKKEVNELLHEALKSIDLAIYTGVNDGFHFAHTDVLKAIHKARHILEECIKENES